jgi:transposase
VICRVCLQETTKELALEIKEPIVFWYNNADITMQGIVNRAKCSVGVVSKVLQNWQEHGEVTDHFQCRRSGCPRALDGDDLRYIESVLEADPTLYLDKIQQKLADVRDKFVSISFIHHGLDYFGKTRKKLSKAALERNETLRTLWENCMAQYTDSELFVFLNESGVTPHFRLLAG